MAESIEMPFGERTAVGPKTNVLGGCLNPLRAKGTFEGGGTFSSRLLSIGNILCVIDILNLIWYLVGGSINAVSGYQSTVAT